MSTLQQQLTALMEELGTDYIGIGTYDGGGGTIIVGNSKPVHYGPNDKSKTKTLEQAIAEIKGGNNE